MKPNWPTKKLGEVCEKVKLKKTPVGVTPYVEIGDINMATKEINFKEKKAVRGSIFTPANSVIVSRVRPTRGAVTILDKKLAISSAFTILKPKPILGLKFLFYSLAYSPNFFNYLGLREKGSSYPSCREEDILNFEIPLPPLKIQKRIVARIEELFEKIDKVKELREKLQEETEQILQSALYQIFDKAKKKWPTKKLGEIIELHYGKGISKKDRKTDGKYPIYGANGELGRTNKYLIEGEAIIIGRKGTAGAVNRVSGRFWPSDVTYYVFGNKQVDIDFLFYTFRKIDLTQLAIGIKPGINRNKVYELQILLPPLFEQKKIVAELDGLGEKVDKLKKIQQSQLEELTELKQSILSKAFKGELK